MYARMGVLSSVREIILFHLMQRLKAFSTFGSQPFCHSNCQGIQQSGRGRHGMVLFFRAPVGKQADVRPLLCRKAGTANKSQSPVARNAAVLQPILTE